MGVQSDMELAFASLHQLCGPLLDRLDTLPAPQRHAMEIVFGLSAGEVPDRFLVGLAVLSLFSEAAEERRAHPYRNECSFRPRIAVLESRSAKVKARNQ